MARPVVGLIGGSGLQDPGFIQEPELKAVETPYGAPSGPLSRGHHAAVDLVFLPRHGPDHRIPPHRVNHRANLWALKSAGVSSILATASSGSLKKTIRPGSFVIPDDFVAFWSIPTYHDEDVLHVTPGLDAGLRDILATGGKAAGASVRNRGVYVQTTGPRLETPAEVTHFATLGDVVGMTMASEATLANELGVRYAAVCSVDNYCNGIVERPLTFDQIRATQERNRAALVGIVTAAVEGML